MAMGPPALLRRPCTAQAMAAEEEETGNMVIKAFQQGGFNSNKQEKWRNSCMMSKCTVGFARSLVAGATQLGGPARLA